MKEFIEYRYVWWNTKAHFAVVNSPYYHAESQGLEHRLSIEGLRDASGFEVNLTQTKPNNVNALLV